MISHILVMGAVDSTFPKTRATCWALITKLGNKRIYEYAHRACLAYVDRVYTLTEEAYKAWDGKSKFPLGGNNNWVTGWELAYKGLIYRPIVLAWMRWRFPGPCTTLKAVDLPNNADWPSEVLKDMPHVEMKFTAEKSLGTLKDNQPCYMFLRIVSISHRCSEFTSDLIASHYLSTPMLLFLTRNCSFNNRAVCLAGVLCHEEVDRLLRIRFHHEKRGGPAPTVWGWSHDEYDFDESMKLWDDSAFRFVPRDGNTWRGFYELKGELQKCFPADIAQAHYERLY
jgi:hypothetical protein